MNGRELDSSELQILEGVVDEFNDRRLRGERPDAAEYARRHPALAAEIRESLLALQQLHILTPSDSRPRATAAPARVADYRIVCELGRGGMGVVYQAVQESLGREVALKVLPQSSLFDETARERFRREANIAAQLHHTNIVPVFGTGESNGVAYYAMQYIEGESLDRVIRRLRDIEAGGEAPPDCASAGTDAAARRLLEGRLADPQSTTRTEPAAASASPAPPLVEIIGSGATPSASSEAASGYDACIAKIGAQVAGALAHAHAHGILHRDVKPSNLILDRNGAVWVTDFGLAKQENQESLTSAGDLVGTLRFMAPERFRGAADVRSDVYSLGLTLYELLTLRPPFEESDRPQMIRRIVESEPVPPRKHRPGIARDLETIVLKAIAKDPDRRYSAAAALAADLERYLRGRPVSARPIGPAERAWRWCRRNPVVASLAASLFLALAVGLAAATWQWRRAEASLELAVEMQNRAESSLLEAQRQRDLAEKNFLRSRQAVDDYLTTVSESALLDVPTLEPVRKELLERAKAFYESFVEDRERDPRLRAETAASYIRLSQVMHDLNEDWLPYIERGLEIIEGLAADEAPFADFRSWREGVYNARSGWLRRDQLDRLAPIVDRAIHVWRRLMEANPEVAGFRSDLAGLEQMRGMVLLERRSADEAVEAFHEARRLRESLVRDHPDVDKFRYGLGESYTMIGVAMIAAGNWDESLQFTIQARELLEPLARANPSATRLADILAAVHQWVAEAHYRRGEPLAALAAQRRAFQIQERLSREYPYVAKFQLNLAQSYRSTARAFAGAGQSQAARASLDKAVALLEQRMADYPDAPELIDGLAATFVDYAKTLERTGDFEDAERLARKALRIVESRAGADADVVAQAYFRVGRVLYETGRPEEGVDHLRAAVEAERGVAPTRPATLASYLYQYGKALQRTQRLADAEAAYRESLEQRILVGTPVDVHQAMIRYRLGSALSQMGRLEEACEAYEASLGDFRVVAAEGDAQHLYTRNQLVGLLRARGLWESVDRILEEYRADQTRRFGVVFGGPWSVRFKSADGGGGDAAERGEARPTEFEASALDLVWTEFAPRRGLPAATFDLTAMSEFRLPPGDYEVLVQCRGRVEVLANERILLAGSGEGGVLRAAFGADEAPAAWRVEYSHRSGPPGLCVWFRPKQAAPQGSR